MGKILLYSGTGINSERSVGFYNNFHISDEFYPLGIINRFEDMYIKSVLKTYVFPYTHGGSFIYRNYSNTKYNIINSPFRPFLIGSDYTFSSIIDTTTCIIPYSCSTKEEYEKFLKGFLNTKLSSILFKNIICNCYLPYYGIDSSSIICLNTPLTNCVNIRDGIILTNGVNIRDGIMFIRNVPVAFYAISSKDVIKYINTKIDSPNKSFSIGSDIQLYFVYNTSAIIQNKRRISGLEFNPEYFDKRTLSIMNRFLKQNLVSGRHSLIKISKDPSYFTDRIVKIEDEII